MLDEWPVPRRADWEAELNAAQPEFESRRVQGSIERNRRLRDDDWSAEW